MRGTRIRVFMRAGNDSLNASEYEFHEIEKFFPNIWEAIEYVVHETQFHIKTDDILDGLKNGGYFQRVDLGQNKWISIKIERSKT